MLKRIVFFGNLEEGVLALSSLLSHYDVLLCVGDKRSDVLKNYCSARGIEYLDGKVVKSSSFIEVLDEKRPDLLVSNNFLYIIPADVLDKYPGINLHSSLLPNFKGRTPVLQAILNGDNKVGYTIHYMAEHVDSGNIILQREVELSEQETASDVLRKLIVFEPDDMLKAVKLALDGYGGNKMGEGISLDAKDYRAIGENDSVELCRRKLRAFVSPYPLPHTVVGGQKVFIHDAVCAETPGNEAAVRLKDGWLVLKQISLNGQIGLPAKALLDVVSITKEK